ncbi:hypothetical protein GYM62_01975 [Algoriphagus sp. NBT04N3]|jgi:hypothetical protein|uniref:hypothetical protein n=1 Tax=Algoriphagus sp. NBT04N3 TaxID=2705473 RepID=UPI001C63B71B|nr:hypothetical protein [Algoriphagus sp. NBT04N3]QYH37629.1 hypothetical protein GYM62_01975 [Algoriphagus sp. NBT04N3]
MREFLFDYVEILYIFTKNLQHMVRNKGDTKEINLQIHKNQAFQYKLSLLKLLENIDLDKNGVIPLSDLQNIYKLLDFISEISESG